MTMPAIAPPEMPLFLDPDLDAPELPVAVLAAAEEESEVASSWHRPLMSKLAMP